MMFDSSELPQQGVISVRVAPLYRCGALGKIANRQAGLFLAHARLRGRALVDKSLYLREAWSSNAGRGSGSEGAGGGPPEIS